MSTYSFRLKTFEKDISDNYQPLPPCNEHKLVPKIFLRSKHGDVTVECSKGCCVLTGKNEKELKDKWNRFYISPVVDVTEKYEPLPKCKKHKLFPKVFERAEYKEMFCECGKGCGVNSYSGFDNLRDVFRRLCVNREYNY